MADTTLCAEESTRHWEWRKSEPSWSFRSLPSQHSSESGEWLHWRGQRALSAFLLLTKEVFIGVRGQAQVFCPLRKLKMAQELCWEWHFTVPHNTTQNMLFQKMCHSTCTHIPTPNDLSVVNASFPWLTYCKEQAVAQGFFVHHTGAWWQQWGRGCVTWQTQLRSTLV